MGTRPSPGGNPLDCTMNMHEVYTTQGSLVDQRHFRHV